jgi:hypothetical protein
MSAYTLLNKDKIVVGPRDWNPKFFEYFLQELGFETTLTAPIIETLQFSDDVKLVITNIEQNPEINPQLEVLAGPNFKYDEAGNHVAYFVAQELPIDTAKSNLRSIVANNRWVKETKPITREINGKQLTLDTSRESRAIYAQALTFVPDEYSSQWKFAEGFVTINKTDLQVIVNEIINYVQECFDWEAGKVLEINTKSSIAELKEIILE